MLAYVLIMTIFTLDGITTKQIEYATMNDCYIAREALEETFDKLNQTTNIGYSIQCLDNK
jgi:hypothetical protein